MVLVKTPESLLDCKEIKSISSKVNQSFYSFEILMQKLKLQYFGHLMKRADSLEKTLILTGKDWRQEEKGMAENEMVGQHLQLNGHEFQQIRGDGEGHGSLACCSPWGYKESDRTGRLNNKAVRNRRWGTKLLGFWFLPFALVQSHMLVSESSNWVWQFRGFVAFFLIRNYKGNSIVWINTRYRVFLA